MFRKTNVVLSIAILVTLLLSACSNAATTMPAQVISEEEPAATTQAEPMEESTATPAANEEMPASTVMLPEVDPASTEGAISAAGSSTVFPLVEAMAARFKDEGYTGDLTIASVGTGGGFERFCVAGETDIANASRAIKDSEVESCAAIGRTPIEFRVGTDALAIVVSSENDFLTNVTIEELAKIFSADAVKWSDINAAWPNEDIKRFSPGTDSGTYDFFVEFVMDVAYTEDGQGEEKILNAANIQFSEDDNVLVQGVEGSPYAIGYFGYAYYQENADKLKILSVNEVTPSFETAESGEYPLARPLFIYSDAAVMQAKPQVAAFINFFLTYVNEEIDAVGYFPASSAALDAAKQAWLEALK